MREIPRNTMSGYVPLFVFLALIAAAIYGLTTLGDYARGERGLPAAGYVLLMIVAIIGLVGLFVVQPNQGAVLTLFGKYMGTERKAGLHWANPFYAKKHLSLRVRNFETSHLKVNDHDGNPIEIAAVVVWKVVDTAEAAFQVDDYKHYVEVQSEAALRNLATNYPYDTHEDHQKSLRGNTSEVAAHLQTEIQDRLAVAGVEVIESRISHLAYAPEIAAVMLQRQQASAVIAARQKIVEGAVGMVEMALEMLNAKGVITFDDERKAAMVSNLLVVLCGDRATQPVINTGTIYH